MRKACVWNIQRNSMIQQDKKDNKRNNKQEIGTFILQKVVSKYLRNMKMSATSLMIREMPIKTTM